MDFAVTVHLLNSRLKIFSFVKKSIKFASKKIPREIRAYELPSYKMRYIRRCLFYFIPSSKNR